MQRVVGKARAGRSLNERNLGFTLIEVSLFLAITGVLIITLLATVGINVSRQRFTDSLFGTQAYLQTEFNHTLNVINDRTEGNCSVSGNTTIPGSGAANAGASNGTTFCVVLGQAIQFAPADNDASATVTSYTVIGTEPAVTPTTSGAALLQAYKPGIDTSTASSYQIPWTAHLTSLKDATHNTPSTRVLYLRAPDSGLVLTFADNGGANLIPALANGAVAVHGCLTSQDITNAVSMFSIANVSGTEAVTTKGDLSDTDKAALC